VTLDDSIDRVRDALGKTEPQRTPVAPESAVLAPLVLREDGLHLLFTRRARTLSNHAGEISFPGGRIEATDASPLDAALRETHEEIGVEGARVDVLGHLVDFLTFRRFVVAAYVGVLRDEDLRAVKNAEVDEAFLIPVKDLLSPQLLGATPRRVASGSVRLMAVNAERFESRRFEGLPESERTILYWKLSNGLTLWGITGQLVAAFLQRCYDWKPPGTPRVVTGAEDVLP